MIHPDPEHQPPSLVYELVPTESLPAFNPAVTTKHLLLSERQAQLFNRGISRVRSLLMPSFVCGYLLRIAATFCSVELGRVRASRAIAATPRCGARELWLSPRVCQGYHAQL